MEIHSTYTCKIREYNFCFKNTVAVYRKAVDFLIDVCMKEWSGIEAVNGSKARQRYVETLVHTASGRKAVYDFDRRFYKYPSYLLRSSISEAIGKVSSYKSNLANWISSDPNGRGRKPSFPSAGYGYPCMYRGNMYRETGSCTTQIKVYIRNTWDWIDVSLRKSDVDYITRHCSVFTADGKDPAAFRSRKICAPTLQKRGKEWFLDFPVEEKVILPETDVWSRRIVSVDLGINNACTLSVMKPDGTIEGREFLSLPREKDHLSHAVNRIKKAQQHGNRKTPRLWAKADGINDRIAVLTAQFIIDRAVLYNADVIVFEHLDRSGKIRGSKKQRLHLWKSQYVQEMVAHKAHRLGMRISRVNAWNTSKLAYDGTGKVLRGKEAGLSSYSVCKFINGKVYNCDLNASYNIGARYFIREILKSLPEKARFGIEANVPRCTKRSTCTLSTLINLNAVLSACAA